MKLFLTGVTGFLGSRLLARLIDDDRELLALVRETASEEEPGAKVPWVVGDLLDVPSYGAALHGVDAIVHLAGLTGKASAGDYARVNLNGTRVLAETARRAGVPRFLFVSSVAARFERRRHYHYGESKARAEKALAATCLRTSIVRPTMIFGPGSANLDALTRLATMPFIPVFGDGKALVQPIHVDDVVAAVVAVLDEDRFDGETMEVGGPEVLTIEQLLRRIRHAHLGRDGPVVRLPFRLVTAPLVVLEKALGPRPLPITAGQLCVFVNDSTASADVSFTRTDGPLRSLGSMIGTP